MIPKIIHIIWIQGSDKLPRKYQSNIESIKTHHATWEIKLWGETEIVDILSEDILSIYRDECVYAAKADIARYFILEKFGGVYLDVDTVCLRPMDNLINTDMWYVPCESLVVSLKNTYFNNIPSKYRHMEIHNGFFGTKQGHGVFKIVEKLLKERKDHPTLVYRTGPFLLTDAIFEYHIDNPTDNAYYIFSRWMFNPIELGVSRKNMQYFNPVSFCDHQSDGSWSLFNNWIRKLFG